jgi:hypothetical protein
MRSVRDRLREIPRCVQKVRKSAAYGVLPGVIVIVWGVVGIAVLFNYAAHRREAGKSPTARTITSGPRSGEPADASAGVRVVRGVVVSVDAKRLVLEVSDPVLARYVVDIAEATIRVSGTEGVPADLRNGDVVTVLYTGSPGRLVAKMVLVTAAEARR